MPASKYVLKVVDMHGNVQTTIDDAALGNIFLSLYEMGTFEFTIPIKHPGVAFCNPPKSEVQVWRNGAMVPGAWFVMTKARLVGQGQITYICKTLDWYFSRRFVGKVPRTGHLMQGSFESGWDSNWTKTWLPGSDPAAPVGGSIQYEHFIEGKRGLLLQPSGGRRKAVRQNSDLFTTAQGATLSAGGKGLIDTIVADTIGIDPRITVNVYYSNELTAKSAIQITEAKAAAISAYIQTVKPEARVFAQGLGEQDPVAKNSTSAGKQQNRRAEFFYRDNDAKKGHKQYLGQEVTLNNPVVSGKKVAVTLRAWCYIKDFVSPAGNQWGLVLERRNPRATYAKGPRQGMHKVVQRAVVAITKDTPMNRWLRMDATVYLPPDGKDYVLAAMLFPPNGESYWDSVNLYTDDAIRFTDQDESLIIQSLVDHAQDPAMGKSDLNIGSDISPTGVKRTREYRFVMRENILDALREFPTLAEGSEWDIAVTPTTRTFTTYFPRKSTNKGYVLKYGDNAYDFEQDIDNDQTSSTVIILKEGEDAAREEASISDPSLLDGLVLEKVYDATPGSSLSSLYAQAQRGIERYRDPVQIPVLMTNPRRCTEILESVETGDVIGVDVQKESFHLTGEHRVMSMTLEPNTDHVALELTPEDPKVGLILDFDQPGWKFFHQDQNPITGATNQTPVESNVEFADPTFDDSGWQTGQAPFGWVKHNSGLRVNPEVPPKTNIPYRHELWMRRTVQCTEEMYVTHRVDRAAYIYVNGNLLTGTYRWGRNFRGRSIKGPIRVPNEFLDPSGEQVIAYHVQDAATEDPTQTNFLIGDVKVEGLYIPENIPAPEP